MLKFVPGKNMLMNTKWVAEPIIGMLANKLDSRSQRVKRGNISLL